MELTYRLTRDEFVQCCKLGQKRAASLARGPQGWTRVARLFAVWVALVLLVLAVLNSGVVDERAAAIACIAYIAGLCSVCLFSLFWRRRYWANLMPDDSSFLSERRLTVEDGGVTSAKDAVTTRYSWHAFRDVTDEAGLILLWIDRSSCVIVPRRALANEAAQRGFVTLVRERIAQAAATALPASRPRP